MSDQQVYAGIDIGATNIKFGLVNSKGTVLFKEQRPTLAEKGADPLMHLIANIGERLLYHAAEEEQEVKWLGVGTPGAVDHRTGKVIGMSPNIAGWQGMQIGEILRDRLNLPVWVDNDANCVALAEAKFGAGIGYKSIVCVTVGTGVGGGVVIDGNLWRGGNHTAGEIGHIPIDMNGPKCRCGQIGCIEAFCSSEAIINRTKSKLTKELTPVFAELLNDDLKDLSIKKLFAAARKKDAVALEVIEETSRYLAVGMGGVVNLLNPEVVLIGGGIADGGCGFVESVAAELRERVFATASENLRVAKVSLGNNAGFIGAGLLGDMK